MRFFSLHRWLGCAVHLVVWLGLALGLGGSMAASPGGAAGLLLDPAQPEVAPWFHMGLLSDPARRLDLAAVRGQGQAFTPTAAPAGNLGPRRDVVWLRLPLRVAGGDGAWVFDIDYPALNDADLYVVTEGRLAAHHHLGARQAYVERPLPARTHAALLQLSPGLQHELYLRVDTASAMVLPIRLSVPATFHAREEGRQRWHGLTLGVALTLLAYSLAHWLSLRNALFGLYACTLLGSTLFLVDYFGLGQQVLWSKRDGLTAMISPLSILLALAAGGLFVTRALDTRLRRPRVHRALLVVAGLAALALVVGLLGGLSYRQAQLVATLLGPLVPLLSIPAAWACWREGDRVGLYMMLGWGTYLFGASVMAGLLRGWVPANVWTQHTFQWCSLIEMLAWLRVLGLHIEAVRRAAERSEFEKQALASLAHTDALTGLPNRRGLYLALEQALPATDQGPALALYLLDLDGFKAVNDSLGHDAGDELLVQVGQRLRGLVRRSDLVARLGGDEFVLMAPGPALPAESLAMGQKLVEAFQQPFIVQGQPCRVGLTVGLALAPQDGRSAAALLKHADRGLYAGKQGGRGMVRREGPVSAQAA